MKLSKQRKLLALILGLAATGFVGDQVFLQGGSATPAAVAAEPSTVPTEEAKGPVVPENAVDPAAATLAERLKKASGGSAGGSDPFKPKWRGVVAAAKPDAKPGTKTEGRIETTAEGFAKTHTLSSLSTNVAMIGKKPCRVGGHVDGWKLVEVDVPGLKAKLERGVVSVELHIKAAEPGAITQSGLKGDAGDEDR